MFFFCSLLPLWLGATMIYDGDRHVEEVIALVSDFFSAQSAYEEAVRRRPGKLITLRQKARVIKKSR
jgi:hypothetical protein